MPKFTRVRYLFLLVLGSSFFCACNRPVAYVQRGAVESCRSALAEQAPAPLPSSVVIMADEPINASVRLGEIYAQTNTQPVVNKLTQSHANRLTHIMTADNEYRAQPTRAIQPTRKLNGVSVVYGEKIKQAH